MKRTLDASARILLLTILTVTTAKAAPFAKLIRFEQPSGERIELWGEGDEFYAVFETPDGYTVVFDPAAKAYYYAKLSADGNDLLSTGLKVGEENPENLGLTPHLRINPQAVKKRAGERQLKWEKEMDISSRWKALKAARQVEDKARKAGDLLFAPPSSPTTGTKIGMTLLVDFPDQAATIPQSNIVDFCNGDSYTGNGNNGSVKKYFYDNSGGLLTYSNVVTIYIRMTQPKTYYDDTSKDAGLQGNLLIRDAIAIMTNLPNYESEILPTFNNLTVDAGSNVVACNVFYAGTCASAWAMGLWPHSWVLAYFGPQELSSGGKKVYRYQITDIGDALEIGTFCHENGHMLCDFPDIYDYDYDSRGGAGAFCLMGYGAYAQNPVQVNAYLKRAAGWTTITELTIHSNLTASLTSSAGPEFNRFYRFQKPDVSTEYFIIENRQKSGRDANLAASGIAIWHVDELGDRDNQSLVTNTTHANYELTLVQADNLWHFQNNVNSGDANDLYYSGNSSAGYNNEFSDTSAPQARWWDGTASGVNFRDFSTSGPTMTFLIGTNYYPGISVLGTNGAVITNDEAASAAKGTDFGAITVGSNANRTLSITNTGNENLTISGITTNGSGASAFQVSGVMYQVSPGGASNFNVTFAPFLSGDFDAALLIVNDATNYTVNVSGTGSKADQTIAFAAIPDQLTTNLVGLSATASSGLPVTNFAVISGPSIISGLTNLAFTNSGTVGVTASQTGDAMYAAAPDVTNTFQVNAAPVQNGWVGISVTPNTGGWTLSAPDGYTGPTSGAGNLAAVSAVTGQYVISYGALSGYMAPGNQTQFVAGGNTTLFVGVYLQISTNIGTPSGVLATEGTYTNKIRISWQGVAGATGYEVWRSQTNDADMATRIADIPENSARFTLHAQRFTYYYDDYNINPIHAYYYWVRAKTATLISPMSYVDMGYAALAPEQATGTADIGVSDLVYLPVNVTNLSHAGTVSCRLINNGPDEMKAAGVAFDFHMGTDEAGMWWFGSSQGNYTLAAGHEQLVILTPQARRGLTVRGDLNGVQQMNVIVRHLIHSDASERGALNDPYLANNTTTASGSVRIKTTGVNSPGRSFNDYDGDGKADGAVYRGSDGLWIAALSGYRYQVWLAAEAGLAGLTPAPGDYDGDGITDMAVYNRSNGEWMVLLSSTQQIISGQFGGPEFTAAPRDCDGDAITDPVVYREADGVWYAAMSSAGYDILKASLGGIGYQPVAADYDGDGKSDLAVYNESSGIWLIGLSGQGYRLMTGAFGGAGWQVVSADYDGDGLADPAIYDPFTATWQVLLSASLETQGHYTWRHGVLGTIGSIPVPADYDGDGKADFALYHQDTGWWELFLSANAWKELSGGCGGPEYQPAKE